MHVGRVNEVERLHICERWRVESVDGTGWMQGTENGRQAKALGQWLEGKGATIARARTGSMTNSVNALLQKALAKAK